MLGTGVAGDVVSVAAGWRLDWKSEEKGLGVILPILLLLLALLCAAIPGYGTDPRWVNYASQGLEWICLARRVQWPVYCLGLLACGAVVLLVVSGKRRAWWLIGLLPVLALFVHGLRTNPMRVFGVTGAPVLTAADGPHGATDDDWVVGVVWRRPGDTAPVSPTSSPADGGGGAGADGGGLAGPNGGNEVLGGAVAYPYAALYRTPVVVQPLGSERGMLVWNPFANLARAAWVDRDVMARELEVVSMPANAVLVYNARYGEFINGVTLRQPTTNKSPSGVGKWLDVELVTLGQWKAAHPDTRVMAVPRPDSGGASAKGGERGGVPGVPLAMRYAVPGGDGSGERSPTVLLATTRPSVLAPGDISDTPVNFEAGGEAVVVRREKDSRRVRAFLRTLPDGRTTRFAPWAEWTKLPPVAVMVDTVLKRGWTRNGNSAGWATTRPAESPAPPPRGRRAVAQEPAAAKAETVLDDGLPRQLGLREVEAVEGPYFEVLKYWYPDLVVHRVTAEDFATVAPPEPPPAPPVEKKKAASSASKKKRTQR